VSTLDWQPSVVVAVGGAIAFPLYNPVLRWVMKLIAKKEGGSLDTSRTHELTNWDAVERATVDLLSTLHAKSEANRFNGASAETPAAPAPA
jgi:menaquinone-dependent protoporphyrinogen IX oxidase